MIPAVRHNSTTSCCRSRIRGTRWRYCLSFPSCSSFCSFLSFSLLGSTLAYCPFLSMVRPCKSRESAAEEYKDIQDTDNGRFKCGYAQCCESTKTYRTRRDVSRPCLVLSPRSGPCAFCARRQVAQHILNNHSKTPENSIWCCSCDLNVHQRAHNLKARMKEHFRVHLIKHGKLCCSDCEVAWYRRQSVHLPICSVVPF